MGQYYLRDDKGLLRGFTIKGDQPSPTEQQRILASMSGAKPADKQAQDLSIFETLTRSVGNSIDDMQAGLATMGEGIAQSRESGKLFGFTPEDFAEKAKAQRAQRNFEGMPEGGFTDQEGFYDKMRFLTGAAGSTALPLIGSTAATLGGAAIGGPPGAIAGLAASSAFYAPQAINENAERQIEEHGEIKDWNKLLIATGGQVALESITDRLTLGVAGLLKKPVTGLLRETVDTAAKKGVSEVVKRMGAAAGVSAVSGATEEVVQSALNRWQADMELYGPEAANEYLESAIVGGILEGTIGAGFGTAGGISDVRRDRQTRQAIEDMDAEAAELSQAARTNPAKAAARRGRMDTPRVAGLLEDARRNDGLAMFGEDRLVQEGKLRFSEDEYNAAIEAMRGEKKVSIDKIRRTLKIGTDRATAIFNAIKRRNDGSPVGSASQYVKILPKRGYVVAPLEEVDATPFTVSFKGKERGERFKTAEEATAWAERAGMKGFEVTQDKGVGQRFGVYETQKEGDQLVGKRLVKAFDSAALATQAANQYDPTYSVDANVAADIAVEAERNKQIKDTLKRELGPVLKKLQDYVTGIVGPGKINVKGTPMIDTPALRALGSNFTVKPGSVIEGATLPDVQQKIGQIIALSTDLYDANLTPDQLTAKLKDVVNHEIVHVLRNLDLLTKPEWEALYDFARNQKLPGKKYTFLQRAAARHTGNADPKNIPEEAIAEMVRLYMRDPTAFSGKPRGILGKINEFFRKLMGLGKRYGGKEVMDAIFGGQIVQRAPGSGGLGLRYAGNPFYSDVIVPTFYMKSDKTIGEASWKEATADQWISLLRNKQIKKEEMDWLRLEDWLKEHEGKISKGDVQDYIRANGIDLQEDWKYNPLENERNKERAETVPFSKPRYQRVTQEGGEDYQELLFIMPTLDPVFEHGHWDEKNVLAHARFNTREIDGKKTLFIEEVQSDLHQIGRREGYRRELTKAEEFEKETALAKVEEKRQAAEDAENNWREGFSYGKEEADDVHRLVIEANRAYDEWERNYNSNIPDAPFKTTWDELAFKRLVRYAVEEGFEQIAWHGEPDSVAQTEGYHDMRRVKEGEETKYKLGATYGYDEEANEPDPDAQDVTGVIHLYTRRLKSWADKYFKKFNTAPEFRPADLNVEKIEDALTNAMDFQMAMADLASETQNVALKKAAKQAVQISRNQRTFNIQQALEPVRQVVTDIELMRELDFVMPDPDLPRLTEKTDQHGNANYAKWVLPISEELRQSVLYEGQPLFSAVEEMRSKFEANPRFRDWFGKSVVTDDDGRPMVVFHGSKSAHNRPNFRTLQHFGTIDAANDRLDILGNEGVIEGIARRNGITDPDEMLNWWKGQPRDERKTLMEAERALGETRAHHRVYPVFLSIQNPLEIIDDGHMSNVGSYQGAALDAIDQQKVGQRRTKMVADAKTIPELVKALKAIGYDGFRYVNQAEDIGSTSWVIFDPAQAKSIFNRGTFSYDEPDIMLSEVAYSQAAPMGQRVPQSPPPDRLAEIEARTTYNNVAPILQKAGSKLPAEMRARYERGVEDTFIGMQDRMLSVGKLIDRLKKNGGFISNENDTYLRAQLFDGQTQAAMDSAERDLYEPLTKAMKNLSITSKDVAEASRLTPSANSIIRNYPDPKKAITELWLYALHAKERNAKMRERNENIKDERPLEYEAGSGMHDDEADAILQWFRGKPFLPQMENIRTLFRAVIAHTNKVRVEAGLNPDFRTMIDPDTNRPYDTYTDYAPIRSWIDEHLDQDKAASEFAKTGATYNIQGKEDPSAVGRASLGADLVAHAFLQNKEAVIRANKNKVGQSFLQLIRDNPALMEPVAKIISVKPRKVIYDKKTGRARFATDPRLENDPMVLRVKEGGKQVYIRIHDPRIAKALGDRKIMSGPWKSVLNFLMKINRGLAYMRTSGNPEFWFTNLPRDATGALINLSELELPGIRAEVAKNIAPALRGVFKGLSTGQMNAGWAKEFEEFRKMGGMTSFYGLTDIYDQVQNVNKMMGDDYSGPHMKVWKGIKTVFKYLDHWNNAFENGTRLAAYVAMRDRFLSMTNDPTNPANIKRAKEQAAFRAKNLTVNFNMGGEAKPVMNAFYLFFNAGLQGSMALINPLIRSKKVRMMWGAVIAAGVMQDLIMSMLGGEDDDGQNIYDKIPQHVLEHNMILMDPFGMTERGYFKIPLPYVMNGIYNTGRAFSRAARGAYTPGEAAGSVTGTMLESLNPWGGANSFLNFVAPTIADPFIDLSQNENFAGEPIAPPESPFGINEKDSQRYWNNTFPAYVSIADWISTLTGSDGDYLPGAIEVSPNQVEYVFDFLSGGVGPFVARTLSLPNTLTSGDLSANDLPLVRRLYGNVTSKNDLQSYIGNRDRVLSVRAELKDAAENADSERYVRIVNSYPDEYRLANVVNVIENRRKKISRQINKIRESAAIPADQKKAMIDALKKEQDELVGRANELFAK